MDSILTRFTMLAVLPATLALAGAKDPLSSSNLAAPDDPCHPCSDAGACKAVEPLQSGADHSCQDHAFHEHRRLVLAATDFTLTSFAKADLRGTEFYACAMQRASLYLADISYGKLLGCDADWLAMGGVQAVEADFSMSSLRHGDFLGANLSGALLVANFGFADLRHADLTGAVLSVGTEMADFCNANLSAAVGLNETVGIALYSPCTNFAATGFDPVAAGWVQVTGTEIGERFCSPAVPNSTGNAAEIFARGCRNVDLNSFELSAIRLPGNEFGVFLCSRRPGFTRAPGSDGPLCLGGVVGAYASHVQNTGTTGELNLQVDLFEVPLGMQGCVGPGETWFFQAWFRDRTWNGNAFVATSQFSDAVSVIFN